MSYLNGSVALVTGAAGQLGRAIARGLASAGALIVLTDVDDEACRVQAAELSSDPTRVLPARLDVTSLASVSETFGLVDRAYGRLDVLVNNAGVAVFTPFEERTVEEFLDVLKVNVLGAFLCTRAAVSLMKKSSGAGSIINIGSIYGVVSGDPRLYVDTPRNTSEVYGASKAALIQMTRHFAVHLAPLGIRVNCVSPGGIFRDQGPGFVELYSQRTPLQRMATEEEVASVVAFLASPQASYVTGQNVIVDGGWTAW